MDESFLKRLSRSVLCLSHEELTFLDKFPIQDFSMMAFASFLISNARRSEPVAFFMDDIVIMSYGNALAASYSATTARFTGERIKGVNEIVNVNASLSYESLRNMFVELEFLVYKIVHLKFEAQRPEFRPERQKFSKLVRLVQKGGLISDDIAEICLHLYHCRREFVHTIQSIDQVKYREIPLSTSFGTRGSPRDPNVSNFFIDDMFIASNALLEIFKPLQHAQIDRSRFVDLLLSIDFDDKFQGVLEG